MTRIGVMLKVYRANAGIEQQALAEEIGIGKSTLSRIESGKSPDFSGGIKVMQWVFDEPENKEG